MLSNTIKNECCGVGLLSIDKPELVKQVAELESQLKDALEQIDEHNALRENKEAFAKKCFMGGVEYGVNSTYRPKLCSIERKWLQFKAENL